MKPSTKPKEAAPASKVETTTRELPCKLNDVEWNNRADDLGTAQNSLDQLENNKKSVMSQLNSDIKAAKARVSKLANVITSRTEVREVVVKTTYDYEKGLVTQMRTDTGDQISQREMTDAERQGNLLDEEEL